MTTTVPEELTLKIERTIDIEAPIEVAFEALLEEIGPQNQTPDGSAMPMKLEQWPGGRWFRDLGDDNGHLWGHVQSIKRPTLLELCGPLFMSNAAFSNVQYRLTEDEGKVVLKFRYHVLGVLDEDLRSGLTLGWDSILERIRSAAQSVQ